MVALVVKGCVPFQVVGRNLQPLGQRPSLGAEQIHPAGSGVKAKPLGVLPAKGEDQGPHWPSVGVQFFCHLGEYHRLSGGSEQAMASQTFCPRAGGHVFHVDLHARGFHPFPGGDVLGVAATGSGLVVLEVAELCDKLGHDWVYSFSMFCGFASAKWRFRKPPSETRGDGLSHLLSATPVLAQRTASRWSF